MRKTSRIDGEREKVKSMTFEGQLSSEFKSNCQVQLAGPSTATAGTPGCRPLPTCRRRRFPLRRRLRVVYDPLVVLPLLPFTSQL
ncbi:hypothetical protein FA95DRAFT_784175 [Auriscalpium vulgare]|uniref:Uncharacterized protein n=1 Tax=Auriscalpium vulgare TaxID=40419 RepID=A0ACB8RAA0_9AGAM|nr:hypothetical protein FA95DRAFT_784175 [Auriscalpium vulgare]